MTSQNFPKSYQEEGLHFCGGGVVKLIDWSCCHKLWEAWWWELSEDKLTREKQEQPRVGRKSWGRVGGWGEGKNHTT